MPQAPARWGPYTAVLVAMGLLLVVLTGLDFAIDRVFDSELIGAMEAECERVVRITLLRKAARRAYVEALERRLSPAARERESDEIGALRIALQGLSGVRWEEGERKTAEGLTAASSRFAALCEAEKPASGSGVPAGLAALLAEIDRLSSRLLARDDPQLASRDEFSFAEELDSGLVRLRRARAAEQIGLSLALIAAMALGLAWARRVERLRAERDASDRLRAELQRMAGVLAHEVNGQLGVLQNAVSVLGRQLPAHEALRFQQESIDQMRALVSDFRLFGASEKLAVAEVDAVGIARSAVAAMGIAVEVSGPEGLLVHADGHALQRALQNLLRNAIESGGPVRLRVERAGGARFLVEDEGAGLTPEVARQAGTPFFTTKQRGTGLGIAIVTDIAQRHGGTFALRNRAQGRGAVAVLEVPA